MDDDQIINQLLTALEADENFRAKFSTKVLTYGPITIEMDCRELGKWRPRILIKKVKESLLASKYEVTLYLEKGTASSQNQSLCWRARDLFELVSDEEMLREEDALRKDRVVSQAALFDLLQEVNDANS